MFLFLAAVEFVNVEMQNCCCCFLWGFWLRPSWQICLYLPLPSNTSRAIKISGIIVIGGLLIILLTSFHYHSCCIRLCRLNDYSAVLWTWIKIPAKEHSIIIGNIISPVKCSFIMSVKMFQNTSEAIHHVVIGGFFVANVDTSHRAIKRLMSQWYSCDVNNNNNNTHSISNFLPFFLLVKFASEAIHHVVIAGIALCL